MYTIKNFKARYNRQKKKFIYYKHSSDKKSNYRYAKQDSQLNNHDQEIHIDNIISLLNTIAFKSRLLFLLINGTGLILFLLLELFYNVTNILPAYIFIFLIINALLIARFKLSHIHIKYELSEYHTFSCNAPGRFRHLKDSSRISQIVSQSCNTNPNKYAGQTTVYNRKTVKLTTNQPTKITSNIKVFTMQLEKSRLTFYPDFVLLYFNNRFIAVPYTLISLSYYESVYNEFEHVPNDATIIGHIWRHPRKDGQPDKRYRNNPRVPQIVYGEIGLLIADCLRFRVQVSDLKAAYSFVMFLGPFCSTSTTKRYTSEKNKKQQQSRNNRQSDTSGNRQEPAKPDITDAIVTAYQILGIEPDATTDEIKKRYRTLIKKYHPDLFTSRGEQYVETAVKKMQHINSAYETIKNN